MALRYTSKLFRAPSLWLCVLIFASSCEIKYSSEVTNTDKKEKSIAEMSQEACDCFSKQKGDIDARMAPCIENASYSQTVNLPEGYSMQDSVLAVGKMKSKMDSINAKRVADLSNMTRYMAVSCDAFGSELEMLYDKWYPINISAANLDSIKILAVV